MRPTEVACWLFVCTLINLISDGTWDWASIVMIKNHAYGQMFSLYLLVTLLNILLRHEHESGRGMEMASEMHIAFTGYHSKQKQT